MSRWASWDMDTIEAIPTLQLPGETGIFAEPTDAGYEQKSNHTCYVCGASVGENCSRFLIDRETDEVLLPNVPEVTERGRFWPIGAGCRKRLGLTIEMARTE